MKKLLSFLYLITGASLYAMNHNARIVPFEYDAHHEAALNIFKKALPSYGIPDALNERTDVENKEHVEILIGPLEQSKEETAIGLLIHRAQSCTYSNYFELDKILKNGDSKVSITREALKRCTLTWLCVDPAYQGKRYGELMLDHLEACAKNRQCDLIDLCPTEKSRGFYKKYNYSPRFLTNDIMLAKGLNDDAQIVLSAISREHTSK